jgi:hypothetical protein
VVAFTVADKVVERLEGEEVRGAMEWARVRALAADEVSERQIAARLGINRRTVARLAAAAEPPRYRRAPRGSMLDPLEPVLARLLAAWPEIKAPRATEILREDYGYATRRLDYAGRRSTRVPLDGYLKLAGNFYRAPLGLVHQRVELRFDRDRVWVCHRGHVRWQT